MMYCALQLCRCTRGCPQTWQATQEVGISLAERPFLSPRLKKLRVQHKERVACCEGLCAALCVSGCKLRECAGGGGGGG
jgi:hypothetical protein